MKLFLGFVGQLSCFSLGARDQNSLNRGWFSTQHFKLGGDEPLKGNAGGKPADSSDGRGGVRPRGNGPGGGLWECPT